MEGGQKMKLVMENFEWDAPLDESLFEPKYVPDPALEPGKEKNPEKEAKVAVIKLITVVMGTLVLLVVIFFYGHSFLWLLREIHEKLKKHK